MKINIAKIARIIGRLVVAAPMIVEAVRPVVKEVRKPKRPEPVRE